LELTATDSLLYVLGGFLTLFIIIVVRIGAIKLLLKKEPIIKIPKKIPSVPA